MGCQPPPEAQLPDGPGSADGHHIDGLSIFHLLHLGLLIQPVQQPTLVIGQVDGHPLHSAVQPLSNGLQQGGEPLSGTGRDGDDVLPMGTDLPRPQVTLVEYLQPGGLVGPQLVDELIHHRRLLPHSGLTRR